VFFFKASFVLVALLSGILWILQITLNFSWYVSLL
jgi:hypothetical protein